MSKIELKNCPFCGMSPKEPEKRPQSGRPIWDITCKLYCITMTRTSKKEVIQDWNKRTGTGFLPKELTAENGAKTLLIGEFIEQIELHDFEDDELYTHNVPVSWATIKEIYKKIVKHYQEN